MRKNLTMVLVAVGLLVGSLGLRFHRLGWWPFASDEVATFAETESLFQPAPASMSEYDRLPRAIPLGYVLLRGSQAAFGRSEWASRLVPAIFGAATVVACFLLLAPVLGTWTAFFAAAILCLSPEHVYHSQYHRFYAVAEFFGWTSLCAGALAVFRRSMGSMAAAVALGILAVLAHAVWAVALAAMVAALVVVGLTYRARVPPGMIAVGLGAAAAVGLWLLVQVRPLLGDLNRGAAWAYSPPRAVAAFVSQLTWPIALMTGVGGVWALWKDSSRVRYWLALAVCTVLAVVGLPAVMAYQPHYGMLLALPAVVLAALGASAVRRSLWDVSRPAAWAWAVAVLVLPLPNLVSYFADGSRYDYRAAAAYLADRFGPDDRIACDAAGVLGVYLPRGLTAEALPPADRVARLAALSDHTGRTWVVLASGRSGLTPDVRDWLGRNARHPRHIEAHRLDYYRFCVDVFLIGGSGAGPAP